ncbi:MAG TPA: tetratricopeptide repeat protein, partial [Candidatus Limnocylindrales bacterium]|nr:tetratricopeptide repeat protein [Candidatus Limnocylindrales bacterium]
MARPLFEQYKDALRRGHVALLGDEFDAALEAYREAAGLVPDRPLPYASIGTVLARLGRRSEALEAFDRALALAPADDATLQARAALLDQQASGEVAPGREPATEPERELAAEAPQPGAAAQPEAAVQSEAPHPEGEPSLPMAAVAGREPESDAASSADAGTPAGSGGQWPAIDLPSPPSPALVGPPPDPAVLQAEAEALLDAGDPRGARNALLLATAVHREAGRVDAALDACLQLLAIAPGDPRVHLAIANLQLDRGWRSVATEKIELLLRLTSLSGDAQAEADVHLLAADRLRDESPARLDARRRG